MDAEPVRGEQGIARSGGLPADQLAALLDRAENGEAAAVELAEVRSALLHWCAVQSCRHTNGPPRPMDRRTYRHSFLLPDGGVRLVWELEHDTGPGTAVHRLVFGDALELAAAEWAVDAVFDLHAGPGVRAPHAAEALSLEPGAPSAVRDATDEAADADATGLFDLVPDPDESGCHRRDYTEQGSPDHARRLMRRASNADAPGTETRRRLRASVGYAIRIEARRSMVIGGRSVSWSLYEHAFLLPDGTELSLWEIDHTRTPDGGPVCEVYGTREAALDVAVRRIEAG
ncbi:DUF6227 family protein [Actinacidiphila yeochonensis]|uniref:DUF6227 family protein n=1 Tax=Actinacidiphila yeochonensis TaxID=89050 RepID=UPI00068D6131|nr:DUF6227 family protein [Actinacidiphila yeochonensis]